METIPLIYITFSHLADTFIQSDLQMRIIEAIKTKSRLAYRSTRRKVFLFFLESK